MADDVKLDFFLRHWKQLVEWSALRKHAAEVFDRALLDALSELASDSETPSVELLAGSTRIAKLHLKRKTHDAWIELQWARNRLFDGGWPSLIVVYDMQLANPEVRAAVKDATASLCAARGLTVAGPPRGWWVWSGELRTEEEPFEIEDFAESCIERFREAWVSMNQPIEQAIAGVVGPAAP